MQKHYECIYTVLNFDMSQGISYLYRGLARSLQLFAVPMQWPQNCLELAGLWTQIAHGTRIFELCSNGLCPVIQKGLVIFFVNGEATELTCTLKFKPPKGIVHAESLVAVAITSLFLTMDPSSALSFCKNQWSFNTGPFLNHINIILSSAIDMPPSIAEACKVQNPNVRSFVYRSWVSTNSNIIATRQTALL